LGRFTRSTIPFFYLRIAEKWHGLPGDNKEQIDKALKNMKEIANNNLYLVQHQEENKLLEIILKNECKNIANDQLQSQLNSSKQIIEDLNPAYILFDLFSCDYFVEPDNFRWYERTLFDIINPRADIKIALVVPQNLFVHASFEATRIFLENQLKNTQYFMDSEKAKYWLLQDE